MSNLIQATDYALPPLVGRLDTVGGRSCPPEVQNLLEEANGFITRQRLFRVFGTRDDGKIPSLETWNGSPWKEEYGHLAENLLFIAEDIFGNQYGFRHGENWEFIKFYCEGGHIEVFDGGFSSFRHALLEPFESGALSSELLDAWPSAKAWPQPSQHFAFILPLVVGGVSDVANLGIESAALHLGLLAQLSRNNRDLVDGTLIRSFSED